MLFYITLQVTPNFQTKTTPEGGHLVLYTRYFQQLLVLHPRLCTLTPLLVCLFNCLFLLLLAVFGLRGKHRSPLLFGLRFLRGCGLLLRDVDFGELGIRDVW